MANDELVKYAKAEAYLNETLAYQAASAVHHLRDNYGLEVEALHLTVAPDDPHHPGVVHITCTVHSVREKAVLQLVAAIDPRNGRTGRSSHDGAATENAEPSRGDE